MLKYCLIFLLCLTLIHTTPSCQVQDASEYLKLVIFSGDMACGGAGFTCQQNFDPAIQTVIWQLNSKGHCTVSYAVGSALSVNCNCHNDWTGIGTLNSILRVQLVSPSPPPPPGPPPPGPPPDPPSPTKTPGPLTFNFLSWEMIVVYVVVVVLILGILFCCTSKTCCSFNTCCVDFCPNCCHKKYEVDVEY